MSTSSLSKVVGVFDRREQAIAAVKALMAADFSKAQIVVAAATGRVTNCPALALRFRRWRRMGP